MERPYQVLSGRFGGGGPSNFYEILVTHSRAGPD